MKGEKKLNEVVSKTAKALLAWVKGEMAGESWKRATISKRGHFSKLRIEMSDGSINAKVETPADGEFFDLLDSVLELKTQSGGERIFAFAISVCPDGRHSIEFDSRKADPSFFEFNGAPSLTDSGPQ